MINKQLIYKIIKLLLVLELFFQMFAFARYAFARYYYQDEERKSLQEEWADEWWKGNEKYSWFTEDSKLIKAEYHPFLGWKIGAIDTPRIQVGKDGIRKTTGNPPEEVTQLEKIFMFGGSTTWGYIASDGETIPSMVAQKLNSNVPLYKITNFGQPGYYSNQELINLLFLLKDDSVPNLAIFYDGCNDLYVGTKNENPSIVYHEYLIREKLQNIWDLKQSTTVPLKNWSLFSTEVFNMTNLKTISRYIKIFHYPKEIIKILTKKDINQQINTVEDKYQFQEQDIEKLADMVADNYIENAKMIDSLSKVYGFNYLLLWQPTLLNKSKITDEEKKVAGSNFDNYRKLYIETTNYLERENIRNFYNLTSIFENNEETLFFDNCHVITDGKQIISDEITKIIKKEKFWEMKR